MSAADLAANPARSPARKRFGWGGQEGILLLVLAVLFVGVGLYNPRFLTENNLTSIFAGNAYIAVAAIGMSLVIICGHIDVSVGSLIGVLAVLSGTLAVNGWPIWLAWTLPILAGMAATGFMGLLVAYARVPSIIVTLGMLSILKGGLISVTAGMWISNLPDGYHLSQMRLLGIPSTVWFMVGLTTAASLLLRFAPFGRAIYAVGGNIEAARAAGVRAERVVVLAFVAHGFFAGIAAILFATQLSVIQSTTPPNLELTVIAAAVVGGVSILGGTGTVVGATLAAILFAAIGSALIFVNVSAYWFRAIQGLLILATVLADLLRRRGATGT